MVFERGDPDELRFYIDGDLKDSVTGDLGDIFGGGDDGLKDFKIMGDGGSYQTFNNGGRGDIQNVRYSDKALTTTEIDEVIDNPLEPIGDEVSFWNMETDNDTLIDQVGDNDGTLTESEVIEPFNNWDFDNDFFEKEGYPILKWMANIMNIQQEANMTTSFEPNLKGTQNIDAEGETDAEFETELTSTQNLRATYSTVGTARSFRGLNFDGRHVYGHGSDDALTELSDTSFTINMWIEDDLADTTPEERDEMDKTGESTYLGIIDTIDSPLEGYILLRNRVGFADGRIYNGEQSMGVDFKGLETYEDSPNEGIPANTPIMVTLVYNMEEGELRLYRDGHLEDVNTWENAVEDYEEEDVDYSIDLTNERFGIGRDARYGGWCGIDKCDPEDAYDEDGFPRFQADHPQGQLTLEGSLFDVKIWQKPLEEAELKELAKQPPWLSRGDEFIHYPLQEMEGRTMKDVANGYDAEIRVNEGWDYNNALKFNEDTDDGVSAEGFKWENQSFSYSVWIKYDETESDYDTVIINDNERIRFDSGGDEIHFIVREFDENEEHVGYPRCQYSADDFDDEWKHVVTTYDSDTGELKMYVNGELVDTETIGGQVLSDDSIMGIGYAASNEAYQGLISDVRVFEKALSAQEAEDLYNDIDVTDQIVMHLPFSEGEGTEVNDKYGDVAYIGDAEWTRWGYPLGEPDGTYKYDGDIWVEYGALWQEQHLEVEMTTSTTVEGELFNTINLPETEGSTTFTFDDATLFADSELEADFSMEVTGEGELWARVDLPYTEGSMYVEGEGELFTITFEFEIVRPAHARILRPEREAEVIRPQREAEIIRLQRYARIDIKEPNE